MGHVAEQNSRPDRALVRDHRRQWRDCLYVYPVISRRAKGLSVGVNLNPDKACNFACVYCQINRGVHRILTGVDLAILHDELHLALEEAVSGRLWAEERFARTPPELRRINDVAFSGDGEPTCLGNFDRAVTVGAAALRHFDLPAVKLVVITNATQLDRPQVQRALPILDEANGEIWAKLDAGTEERFQRINRPHGGITLERIVENIASVARGRPVVIQSLLLRLDGEPPGSEEVEAYCDRLVEIGERGGQIRLVQLHSVARPPAEASASTLGEEQLEAIAARVRERLGDVPVETYPGQNVPPQRAS